jgi:hypothetical protein
MKKTLSVLISALLAFAGLTVVSAPANAADRTVTIHYHRFDGAYDTKTLWIWNNPNATVNESSDQFFEVDESLAKFQATFTFVVSDDTKASFGFLVRNGNNWDDGKDHEGSNADNADKAVTLNASGDTDVWIVEASNTVYYEEPAFPQAVDSPAASVKVGKLIKLDARTDKAAVVTWTSKTKKVCSVVMKKGKPNVKGLKKGLCRIKAVAVGVGEYGAYNKTIALYVN